MNEQNRAPVPTRARAWPLAAACLAACASSPSPTQLLVVADSDLAGEIDHIEFVVSSATGQRMRRATASVLSPDDVPQTLALIHESSSPLGPIDIAVRGKLASDVIVEVRAQVHFVEDETRTVPLHLLAACRTVSCPTLADGTARTCDAPHAECVPVPRSADALPPFVEDELPGLPSDTPPAPTPEAGLDAEATDAGEAAAPDAGSDASTADAVVPETCGTDSPVDLMTDPAHCGRCDQACPSNLTHGSASCVGGECKIQCETDWDTCGAVEPCSTSLTTDSHCGSCENDCGNQVCRDDQCTWR